MRNSKQLQLQQLNDRLRTYPFAANAALPSGGWIRAIRQALGVTNLQLARRAGRDPNTVSDLQVREASQTIRLKSLRELANALDCDLVYAVIPRKPLDEILEERARMVAGKTLRRTGHPMELERQGLGAREHERAMEREVERLLAGSRRKLWE